MVQTRTRTSRTEHRLPANSVEVEQILVLELRSPVANSALTAIFFSLIIMPAAIDPRSWWALPFTTPPSLWLTE